VVVGTIEAPWTWRGGGGVEREREVETILPRRNDVFHEKLQKSEDDADGRTKDVEVVQAKKGVEVYNRGRVELKLFQIGGTSKSN